MRKLTTALLTGSALLLFTACGGSSGGGSSTPAPVDPMTQRQAIIINYHTPMGMCVDPTFQNYFISGMASEGYPISNILFREESLNVSCSTYGKANDADDYGGCVTQDFILLDPSAVNNKNSCVVGFDMPSVVASSDMSAVGNTINLDEIKAEMSDIIISWQ